MESVYVVKAELLRPYLREKGLITSDTEAILRVLEQGREFLPRPQMEEDPGYKQVIPYILILRGDEMFATRRLKKGTETRLHGLLSLGIGGHINPVDTKGGNTLQSGLERELHEEVAMTDFSPEKLQFRGVINDNTNGVGSVHLGLLYTLETTGEVTVRETEKLAGEWLKRTELSALSPEMESWSQIVIGLFT